MTILRSRRFARWLPLVLLAALAGLAYGSITRADSNGNVFWRHVHFDAVHDQSFESLDGMVKGSDVIVTGWITKLEESRSWVAVPELGDDGVAFYAKATIRVEDVLAGDFLADDGGNLAMEVFLVNWRRLPQMSANLPTERVMLFLDRKAELEDPVYRLVNVEQGYIRDGGHADPPVGALDPWLTELHGKSFGALADEVRRLAQGT